MSQTERQKRLRLLIRKLNQQRKQQASKIDILCHDMVSAHRSFIHRLRDVGFAAELYHSLLGSTDLNDLLSRAGRLIEQDLPGVGVVFFIRQPDGCELHTGKGTAALCDGQPGPQEYFDAELVDSICKSSRPCTSDDLARLSLYGTPEGLNQFSLVTLPLADLGRSLGFVLVYCPLPQVLNLEDLSRISPAMCGLAKAIRSARVPLPSGD